MAALVFVVVAVILYILSYRFYAKFLSEKIWMLDPKRKTPAFKYEDGFEFVPTRTDVVAGHHFTSIAGAAPIVGPVVAAIWGWLPGLLWIIIGTIFFGAVHDLGALATSLRHEGRGIADFLQDLLGKRAMQLMYILIFFLLILVSAVFVHITAVMAQAFPAAVYSIWVEIPLAIIIGLMIRYKVKFNIYFASIISVAIMYGVIALGLSYPLQLSYYTWVVILLVYMFISARLPVWLLVQPRDFINGLQLIIALVVTTAGVIILAASGGGQLAAPAIRLAPEGAPPIWPFIMVTIACGAISGWHSIVGSGTTPKQLRRETDAKVVGYGSMLAEGYLAVIALLTAVVGLGVAGYSEVYSAWEQASWPAVWAEGGSTFVAALGIPTAAAAAFMAVVAKSFAMTTLDSSMRFTRIAFAESVITFGLPKALANKTFSILPGWVAIVILAFSGYGMRLWPLFGASNQILASLALLAAAVFLLSMGRSTVYYIVPFVVMIVTSMLSMAYSILFDFIPNGDWLLVFIGAVVFICGTGVVIIALQTWSAKKEQAVKVKDA
ncbi:carbon starvation CstA family protein [Candidatus Contubernalis alkaliaceticus]|uniref:carbon starvation CstA family protein n=1 Tax=Candidatus Contubernalis alkaliaceticus TaxID=338645 RepID=UPI001F4C20A8|nr:carbon starvation protein A [Candidatus Contubernalis alkalaceticus]UNC91374.1 carbon starvation protein A [Candidatus Contubernalis alkalaceticus]